MSTDVKSGATFGAGFSLGSSSVVVVKGNNSVGDIAALIAPPIADVTAIPAVITVCIFDNISLLFDDD